MNTITVTLTPAELEALDLYCNQIQPAARIGLLQRVDEEALRSGGRAIKKAFWKSRGLDGADNIGAPIQHGADL